MVKISIMVQRTANEHAACLRRICKRSHQPKIERLVNNDARLILRRKLNGGNDMIEVQTENQELQPWTAVSTLLGLVSTLLQVKKYSAGRLISIFSLKADRD